MQLVVIIRVLVYALMLISHFGEFMLNATIYFLEIKSTCRILCTAFKLSSCVWTQAPAPLFITTSACIATVIYRHKLFYSTDSESI